ncbi:MAG: O-antigen ligase family protein [Patescibacteria group bacterium]
MSDVFIILLTLFIIVVAWRPYLGGLLVLSLLPSYILRDSVIGIPTTLLEMMIVLWFVITVIHSIRTKRIHQWMRLLKSRVMLVYGLFVLVGLLTALFAPDIRLALGAWKGWMLGPFVFVLTSIFHYRLKRDAYALTLASCGTLLLVSIWGMIEYIGGFGMQIPGYINAMFSSANYVALLIIPLWFVSLGLSLHRVEKKLSSKGELVWWVFFHALVGVTILLTKSYAGILAATAGVLYIAASLPRDFIYRKLAHGMLMIVAVGAGLFILSDGKLDRFANNTSYNSFETRQQIWTVTWDLIQDKPLVGIGFGNFEPVYYDRAFELFSPPLEWEVPRAHNIFLHTWVEMGLVGLAMVIGLLWLLFSNLRNLLLQPEERYMVFGVVAALLSVVVHGLLDTPYFKNDLSIVFVYIIVLVLILTKKGESEV